MKVIKPKVEILPQGLGLEGIYEHIKTAGQTCYDSESKRTPEEFVEMLIKSGHGAMLEHGTVYLTYMTKWEGDHFTEKYQNNPYSRVTLEEVDNVVDGWVQSKFYITTNYRVLVDNDWLDDLLYLTEPTVNHIKRVTVRFTTQIAISREYNRHRVNSIAEQSTRYCNYAKGKYENQISVAKPQWIRDIIGDNPMEMKLTIKDMCQEITKEEDISKWDDLWYWLFGNLAAEYAYLNLIRLGRTAQEARTVLPLDTRTELVHTAFVDDWCHFFDLRSIGTTGKPHPDAKALADHLLEQFKQLKLI